MKKLITLSAIMTVLGFLTLTRAEAPNLDPAELTAQSLYKVSANWSSLKRGENTLVLKITDGEDQPITGATISVTYDMADMPMNPPNYPIEEKEGSIYEKRVFLGMRGNWKFKINVRQGETEDSLDKIQRVKN